MQKLKNALVKAKKEREKELETIQDTAGPLDHDRVIGSQQDNNKGRDLGKGCRDVDMHTLKDAVVKSNSDSTNERAAGQVTARLSDNKENQLLMEEKVQLPSLWT